jgi:hypothetical protein
MVSYQYVWESQGGNVIAKLFFEEVRASEHK